MGLETNVAGALSAIIFLAGEELTGGALAARALLWFAWLPCSIFHPKSAAIARPRAPLSQGINRTKLKTGSGCEAGCGAAARAAAGAGENAGTAADPPMGSGAGRDMGAGAVAALTAGRA